MWETRDHAQKLKWKALKEAYLDMYKRLYNEVIMTDKLREIERYLKLQIKETERLMRASKVRHDTVDADKWAAVSDAYEDCYTRLFGRNESDFDVQFGRIKAEYNRLLHCAETADQSKRHIFDNAARTQIDRCKLLFADFGFDDSKDNVIKALSR